MTFDDLTPEWLTTTLGRGEVRDFAWKRIGGDQGFSSKLARIVLRYASSETTVVAKIPAGAAEVRSYREFAGTAPLARCYAGEADEYLLLEDVPGRVGDAVAGCDADDAARVLAALARMHAAHREHPPGWPRRVGADPAGAQKNHDERVPAFLARYGARLPASHRERIERLRPHYGATLGRMAGAPLTLLHGDLHLDNIVFGDRVVFLDWEHPAVGNPVYDVAWFLYPSLRPDERRAHEDELLRGYHDALAADGYDYEHFRDDLRAALAVLYGALVNGISRLDPAKCHPRQLAWIDAALAPGPLFLAAEDARL